jgi:hypothetical protein
MGVGGRKWLFRTTEPLDVSERSRRITYTRSKRSYSKVKVIKHYAMKAYEGVDVYIHVFLTSALVGGEWLASRPGRFTPGERDPGTHWAGGWVGPRAGLDDVEKRKISPPTGTWSAIPPSSSP